MLYVMDSGDKKEESVKFLEGMTIPIVIHFVWIFLVTAIVIILSRRNKKLSAHKKHMF